MADAHTAHRYAQEEKKKWRRSDKRQTGVRLSFLCPHARSKRKERRYSIETTPMTGIRHMRPQYKKVIGRDTQASAHRGQNQNRSGGGSPPPTTVAKDAPLKVTI